jgi:alcohol dehydrogenase class IV
MQFEFATAGRIIFGIGTREQLPDLTRSFGVQPLVVTGSSRVRIEWLTGMVNGRPVLPISGEPTVEVIRQGVAFCRECRCDIVVGIGGGSVLDAAKAIAALAPNSGDPLEYLEVIGKGRPLDNIPLPVIAVPTTAGTGSEVTRNAVLGSPEHRVKASLRSASMLPRVAVIDPEMTVYVPPDVTATTGLDAITQLIEPYVSKRANPMTDGFCLQGLRLAATALPRAFANGRDREARTDMAAASLLGGLALANAGLGVVHGFAAPLGGMYDAPHGALCAGVLPYGIAANIRALRERDPNGPTLRRYRELAGLVTGASDAQPEALSDWALQLCKQLSIPRLNTYGISGADLPEIARKAATASSMKANPIELSSEELVSVLEASL